MSGRDKEGTKLDRPQTDVSSEVTRSIGDTLPGSDLSAQLGHEFPTVDPEAYQLGDEFARGGLGRIVEAKDKRLERTVAIKELLNHEPRTEARFIREAL